MMKNLLGLSSVLFLCAGCGLLQPRGDLSIDDQEKLIHDATKTGVFLAITTIYEDEDKQVEVAEELKRDIDHNILNGILLDPTGTVDEATEKLLFSKIPPEYMLFLQNAFNLLRTYYETPEVGEILEDDKWRLLTAAFRGISDGCSLIVLRGS